VLPTANTAPPKLNATNPVADPGILEAITPAPKCAASSSTIPNASLRSIEGKQTTSQDSYSAANSVSLVFEKMRTRLDTPKRSARAASELLPGPRPTIMSWHSGRKAIALINKSNPL
jgi:hypothetical protein